MLGKAAGLLVWLNIFPGRKWRPKLYGCEFVDECGPSSEALGIWSSHIAVLTGRLHVFSLSARLESL